MDGPTAMRTLYEVNTRTWLRSLGASLGDVPDNAMDALVDSGADAVWLMGVWTPSPWSIREARAHPGLRAEYLRALGDVTDDDIVGSPYAVMDYTVAPSLGGDAGLAIFRQKLRARGVGLVLDFVPNHTACDHAWLRDHPEYYVQPADGTLDGTFVTAAGVRVMHGRDPYFPAWTDTAQLDYRRRSTRAAVTRTLMDLASRCDGLRCDMAMLPLQETFARTWEHPGVRLPPTNDRATGEYWPEGLDAVRAQHPLFVMIAEAYWNTERRLQHLGFDYTYDKTLYDHLAAGDPQGVNGHLAAGRGRHRRAVHFIENHDEPRAAERFAPDLHPLAALLALTLPGVRLLQHGQFMGARTRVPVQLRRGPDETVDLSVQRFYLALRDALRDRVIAHGSWHSLAPYEAWPGNPSHTAFVAYGWDGSLLAPRGGHRLLVVNLAPHRAQCRLPVGLPGLGGRVTILRELLGVGETPRGEQHTADNHPVYLRDGDSLARDGLFMDLPGRCGQLLAVAPTV